jgi:hypothetical protein
VKFRLMLSTRASRVAAEPQGEVVRRYDEAFVSYASADRAAVLHAYRCFPSSEFATSLTWRHSIRGIAGGGASKRVSIAAISSLFWSRRAKRSRLVRAEVRHALARQGGDALAPPEIRPLILDRPPVSPPRPELRELHFDDRLAYLTADESHE